MVTKSKNVKYWEFKNKSTDEADLYLYIEIASWGWGNSAHSAQSFKRELDALGSIKTLNIYINSPGGDVFEGHAIYNMLSRKAKSCQLNVYVDGLAASIASVIAMAGTKVIMPANAMMIIHNAWCDTRGNAKDLKDTAAALEKIDLSIKQTYLSKAGDKIDEETLNDLMNNETWLTAQECLDYGLCDEIVSAKQVAAKFDKSILQNYKNVPLDFSTDGENANPQSKKAKLLMELDLI